MIIMTTMMILFWDLHTADDDVVVGGDNDDGDGDNDNDDNYDDDNHAFLGLTH